MELNFNLWRLCLDGFAETQRESFLAEESASSYVPFSSKYLLSDRGEKGGKLPKYLALRYRNRHLRGCRMTVMVPEGKIPSDVKKEGCFMNVKTSENERLWGQRPGLIQAETRVESRGGGLVFTFIELQALGKIPGEQRHLSQSQQLPRQGSCQYFFLSSEETEACEVTGFQFGAVSSCYTWLWGGHGSGVCVCV